MYFRDVAIAANQDMYFMYIALAAEGSIACMNTG
jgi:hypothetical protein